MSVTIVQSDILTQDVDAIVNPANSHLRHGGGLAAIIAKAAIGPPMPNPGEDERVWWSQPRPTAIGKAWQAEQDSAPLIPTGGAHMTSAGALPFKAVIHAVGPVWGGGDYCEEALLMRAHDSACRTAIVAGFESVAIPAISCGIFGYPVRLAARVAVGTVRTYAHALDITLCLFESAHYDAYLEAGYRSGVVRP